MMNLPFRKLRSTVIRRKLLSAFLAFLLLFQNILPVAQVGLVLAQESPAPVVEEVQATPVPESTQEPEMAPAPEATPTPESTPALETTPTPLPETTPTPSPESSPEPESIPASEPSTLSEIPATESATEKSTEQTPLTVEATSDANSDNNDKSNYNPLDILAIPLNIPTFENGEIKGTAGMLATPTEQICSLGDGKIVPTETANWEINAADGTATTKDKVQLGVQYVYPLESKVSVTFKCLPKDESLRSNLKIQQISASKIDFPEGTYPASDYAYDITTDGMKNGTFEYDVTLPNREGIGAQITYLEKSVAEATSQSLSPEQFQTVPEGDAYASGDKIHGTNLDHFTILIATTESNFTTDQSSYVQGEDVYLSATGLDTSNKYYRIDVIDPDGVSSQVYGCSKPSSSSLQKTYSLSATAKIGANWQATLQQFDNKNNCDDKTNSTGTSSDTFEVKQFMSVSSTGALTTTNACMGDLSGGGLTCTANDVTIADVTGIKILDDGCKYPGDTVTFEADWQVLSGANKRYDIGLWFATAGQTSALSGSCSTSILPNSPVPPWFNYDGDACGDINSSTTLTPKITLTVACTDPDGDNTLNLPYCTSWQQNTVGVCSVPTDTLPGAPSKCNCNDGYEVPIVVPYQAKIEVVKDLVPNTDPGTFDLKIDGTTEKSCASDNGTTGAQVVGAGTSEIPGATHTIAEASCLGTDTSNYTTNITCVKRGTSTVVASATGALTVDVPVQKDDDIVCTITNSRVNNASITIVKNAVPDNAQDFAFTTTGTGLSNFSLDDDADATLSNTKTFTLLAAGTYAVAETAIAGWTQTSAICSDGSPVSAIDLSAGENVTCTFTNTAIAPTLTLVKMVTNNNGGSALASEWTLSATGTGGFSGNGTQDPTLNMAILGPNNVNPGVSYTLGETGPTGYSASTWSCVKNTQAPVIGNTITLAYGDVATCTITNDDLAGTLIVKKVVVNDDGGLLNANNFSFQVNSGTATPFEADGQNDLTVNAGTYSVTEPAVSGYATTYDNCSSVVIPNGGTATCTITNNDIPAHLIVIKHVDNTNGGTSVAGDFTMTINGITATGGNSFAGAESPGTDKIVLPGTYNVTESGPDGYQSNFSTDCMGTIALGQTKTCTVTNDDKPATLIVKKHVITDNGGTAVAGDFTMNVTGTNVSDTSFAGSEAGTSVTLDAGSYSVDEIGLAGYAKTLGANCAGTISVGQSKTCTIANDDIAPSLTLDKIVINNNGSTALESAWTLTANGGAAGILSGAGAAGNTDVVSGNTFKSGTYVLSESAGPGGYSASAWSCTEGVTVNGNSEITLGLGQTTACSITNDDLPAYLTVTKHVVGGTDLASSWDMVVRETSSSPDAVPRFPGSEAGTTVELPPTTYTITESGPENHTLSYSGDCDAQGQVAVVAGTTKNCTLTNTRDTGSLKVNKLVDTNGDGSFETANPTSFTWSVDGTGTNKMGTSLSGFTTGAHTISENDVTNYHLVTWYVSADTTQNCSNSTRALPANITVNKDQTSEITICNARNTGMITIDKVTSPTGDSAVFDFKRTGDDLQTVNFSLADSSTPISYTLPTGVYNLEEINIGSNWTLTGLSCDQSATINLANHTASFDLDNNEHITCAFTNTKQGKIIIEKQTTPNTDTVSSFEFDPSYKANFFLGNMGADDSGFLAPGSYTVTELDKTGWDMSGLTCSDPDQGTTINGTTATIDLDAGEEIHCIYDNTQRGSITITKNTVGADGTFNFDSGTLPVPGFAITTVANTGNTIFTNLLAGSFDVYESVPMGWELTDLTCDDPDRGSGTDLVQGLATIDLDPGENITCTFTNTKLPTLTINKTILPDDDTGLFNLQIDGMTAGTGANVGNGGTTGPVVVSLGEHIVAETAGTNTSLSDYAASSLSGDGCINSHGTYKVNLAAGENRVCTITNTKKGRVIVKKQTVPAGSTDSFEFWSNYSGTFYLTDGQLNESQLIDPNQYRNVVETVPAGWTLTDSTCVSSLENPDQPASSFYVNPGETITCSFVNTRDTGEIIVHKLIDVDGNLQTTDDQSAASGWEFDINGQGEDTTDVLGLMTVASGATSSGTINTGSYNIRETTRSGYDFLDAYCDNESGNTDGPTLYSVDVDKDEVVNCTFINTPNGTIHGYKWEDIDGDGSPYDEGENKLAGWTINVFRWNGEGYDSEPIASMETDDGEQHFGWYWFEHLYPGQYKVCEELQTGWVQTYPSGDENCHYLTLPDDNSNGFEEELNATEGPVYKFGNQENKGILQITKTNNSYPNTQRPGDTITYTLTITAKDGVVNNVEMIDVPQDGFNYVNNSWTASSSVRGDIKNAPTTQPTYGSPGKWLLGNMIEDEVVTLTYQAKIGDDVTAGTYPDLAYAYGTQKSGTSVLAEAQPLGYISPEYVGTNVVVAISSSAGYDVERKETVTGQVLGASTELPATGMPVTLPLIALGAFLTGLISLAVGLFLRRRHALARVASGLGITLVILLSLCKPASAYNSLSLRVEQLPSPYNQKEFKLRYVVLDIDNRPITISCFKKGPSNGSYSTFSSPTAIQAGGDNHYCNVTSDITGEAGTYQFYVVATAGADTFTSPVQAVDLRTNTGPGTPTNYSRDRQSCKDRLTFRAADDGGKTSRIEVYRSTEKSFSADSGSRIDNFGASSNENFTKEYDRPDCGRTYYYVLRAFDSANNGSGLVGDTETTYTTVNSTTTTTTTTSPTTATGALPVYYEEGTGGSTGRIGGLILGAADEFKDVIDLNGDGKIEESELAAASASAQASAAAKAKAEQEKAATQGATLGNSIGNFFSNLLGFFPWLIGLIINWIRGLFS